MAGNPIPDSFPTMGAFFEKPYMEIEYEGELYRLEQLKGGHNGKVAAACKASPPVYDPERGRWVVHVTNNIIDIDLPSQPNAIFPRDLPQRIAGARIVSNPRRSFSSTGVLLSETTSPSEAPRFPVDSEFDMHIRVHIPGRGTVINVRPFRLVARGLDTWPPPKGTAYENQDDVELFPEWVPFGQSFFSPVARIVRGDRTILTEVFEKPDLPEPIDGWITRLINRFT